MPKEIADISHIGVPMLFVVSGLFALLTVVIRVANKNFEEKQKANETTHENIEAKTRDLRRDTFAMLAEVQKDIDELKADIQRIYGIQRSESNEAFTLIRKMESELTSALKGLEALYHALYNEHTRNCEKLDRVFERQQEIKRAIDKE